MMQDVNSHKSKMELSKKLLSVFFALFLCTAASADSLTKCSEQKDEVQYTRCLKNLQLQAEKQLHLSNQNFQRKIEVRDEDTDYKEASLKAFSKSVDSFNQFLTDECALESSMAAEGNGKEAIVLHCRIALINQRIKHLKAHESQLN